MSNALVSLLLNIELFSTKCKHHITESRCLLISTRDVPIISDKVYQLLMGWLMGATAQKDSEKFSQSERVPTSSALPMTLADHVKLANLLVVFDWCLKINNS